MTTAVTTFVAAAQDNANRQLSLMHHTEIKLLAEQLIALFDRIDFSTLTPDKKLTPFKKEEWGEFYKNLKEVVVFRDYMQVVGMDHKPVIKIRGLIMSQKPAYFALDMPLAILWQLSSDTRN